MGIYWISQGTIDLEEKTVMAAYVGPSKQTSLNDGMNCE
jgi:hypothetical protein